MTETSNVVAMPGVANVIIPGEPVEAVLAMLREWMESAEYGDIVQVVVAGVKRGGGSKHKWQGLASLDQTLAAATALQARVAAAYVRHCDEDC
jgi:hypothetical protein